MVAINDELGEKNRGEHWSPLIELSCMQIRDGDLRIAELRCLRRGKTYRPPEGTARRRSRLFYSRVGQSGLRQNSGRPEFPLDKRGTESL
jgi:hypothetical protein